MRYLWETLALPKHCRAASNFSTSSDKESIEKKQRSLLACFGLKCSTALFEVGGGARGTCKKDKGFS